MARACCSYAWSLSPVAVPLAVNPHSPAGWRRETGGWRPEEKMRRNAILHAAVCSADVGSTRESTAMRDKPVYPTWRQLQRGAKTRHRSKDRSACVSSIEHCSSYPRRKSLPDATFCRDVLPCTDAGAYLLCCGRTTTGISGGAALQNTSRLPSWRSMVMRLLSALLRAPSR